MRRIVKQMFAMLLALVMVFTLSPCRVNAGGKKIKIASSGKVSTILYKGAKPKKAKVSVSSELVQSGWKVNEEDPIAYDVYRVYITIKKSKPSKNDIIKVVKESKKKNTDILEYGSVIVDSKGNQINGDVVPREAEIDYTRSSNSKILRAKGKGGYFSMYGWLKTEVHNYLVYIPQGMTDVYIGVAGLRKGQISGEALNQFRKGQADYYNIGFGNSKKGYLMIAPVRG